MHCVACGHEHALASGERIAYRDTCARCGADLHSCRHCAQHDPGAYNECREPGAERIADRERANRCEWFTPPTGRGAGDGPDARPRALDALQALFRPKSDK
jgi:hypothetical protein